MELSTKNYDFAGWATCCNRLCSDGRTIMPDAFKHHDGEVVPLVWNHQHNDPTNILGKALLHSRDGSMYAYCQFNDTEAGQQAKELVQHGDICSLSIFANQLKHNSDRGVTHGKIREVSLVLAGANPGAFIDTVTMSHGEESEEEAIIFTGENISLYHAETQPETKKEAEKEEPKMAEETKKEKTVQDVIDSMTEEQKTVMYAIIGQALEDKEAGDDKDEEDNDMRHNVFDNDHETNDEGYLSHADQEMILTRAKKVGSFRAALEEYADDNNLQHDAIASGFAQTGTPYNITTLFPDYKEVRPGAPELITDDQGWVGAVMNGVHKSPISRIRTTQVDIRNIDGQMEALRAKGYKKGKEKGIVGNYNLVRRTTDPQTVYVKSALHRDDIIDMTDFDIVGYQYNIDRMFLNEELATAILFGDGRVAGSEGKIDEDKIRPIWKDDELYTLHVDIDFAGAKTELQGTGTSVSFGENYIRQEAMVNACLYAREKYKGTGTPVMLIDPHELNVMLLARDMNGRRIYSSISELATSLNVGKIIPCEKIPGKTRTATGNKTKKLHALIVNFADYSLGATKGGQITHFTQFDIDFNQEKSLLETRCSGALTRVYSAIAIEEDITAAVEPEEEDAV